MVKLRGSLASFENKFPLLCLRQRRQQWEVDLDTQAVIASIHNLYLMMLMHKCSLFGFLGWRQ